jgi:GNAT superfamily N-acetyltransferase
MSRNYLNIPFSLLRFEKSFEGEVCKLVEDSQTLELIGEEKGERLTPLILDQWITRAEEAFVLVVDSEVIGFGTIGCKEWAFPPGYCEVGHLIIKSTRRRRGYGSILLLCLLDEIRKRGFTCAVGRVCVGNEPPRLLLKKQGWLQTTRPEFVHDNRFEWFYRECQAKKRQNSPSH